MKIAYLHSSLVNAKTINNNNWRFWFFLSIVFAAICGLLGLQQGFSSEFVVQDDARQHVFWMLRYLDRELFPDDLIADYFQSAAPIGYKSLYRLGAIAGINPLVFNKLLPPFLGIIATIYCFCLTLELFCVPFAAFVATLLFNQSMWMKDDVISATPRAFVYPLLLAFVYYLSRRSLFPLLISIALLGLFYPQGLLLAAVMLVLQLLEWRDRRFYLSRNQKDFRFCAIGLGVAVAILLPFAFNISEYGPTISFAQARQLPEFYDKGRSAFFKDSLYDYWFGGGRSGMFPQSLFTPATTLFAFLLPILRLFPRQFPLIRQTKPSIIILWQLIIASVVMFVLAHLFLFKLHLPSRYTGYSFRIVMAIAAGIGVTSLLETLGRQILGQYSLIRKILMGSLAGAISISLLFYPFWVEDFPVTKYKTGGAASLYQYFQKQPKDTLIATLVEDADNFPTFARRSILVSREYAIPYHLGYYRPFRQRAVDSIEAQYSSDPAIVGEFIDKYGIDLWVVEKSSFTPEYLAENRWIRQHQTVTSKAIASLKQSLPLVAVWQNSCSVFRDGDYNVISAQCLQEKIGK